MAKSSRASTVKANNQRLKAKVFNPVEEERATRLSAKLLALAAQPKPEPPASAEEMKIVDDGAEEEPKADEENHDDTAMDLDTATAAAVASKRSHRKRIEMKRKTSKIVFPKYKDRVTKRRKN